MHDCTYQIHLFQTPFFKSVIVMFDNELQLVSKSLNLLQRNAVQAYHF